MAKSQPAQKEIQTATPELDLDCTNIFLSEQKSNKFYTFHCLSCGFILFQHLQGVKLAIPAEAISMRDFNRMENKMLTKVEMVKPPIILRCRNCKHQYNVR